MVTTRRWLTGEDDFKNLSTDANHEKRYTSPLSPDSWDYAECERNGYCAIIMRRTSSTDLFSKENSTRDEDSMWTASLAFVRDVDSHDDHVGSTDKDEDTATSHDYPTLDRVQIYREAPVMPLLLAITIRYDSPFIYTTGIRQRPGR